MAVRRYTALDPKLTAILRRSATGYRSGAQLIGLIYDTNLFLRSRPTPFGLSIAHRSRRENPDAELGESPRSPAVQDCYSQHSPSSECRSHPGE